MSTLLLLLVEGPIQGSLPLPDPFNNDEVTFQERIVNRKEARPETIFLDVLSTDGGYLRKYLLLENGRDVVVLVVGPQMPAGDISGYSHASLYGLAANAGKIPRAPSTGRFEAFLRPLKGSLRYAGDRAQIVPALREYTSPQMNLLRRTILSSFLHRS